MGFAVIMTNGTRSVLNIQLAIVPASPKPPSSFPGRGPDPFSDRQTTFNEATFLGISEEIQNLLTERSRHSCRVNSSGRLNFGELAALMPSR